MKGIGVPLIAAAGIDLDLHIAIIKLAITYTLALAFIFTVSVTCLSLLGWVKFANKNQQKKLFATVIVQLAIGCIGVFTDFLSVTPTDVKKDIASEYEQRIENSKRELAELDAKRLETQRLLAEQQALLAGTRQQLASAQRQVGELQTVVKARDLELAKTKSTLSDAISKLPVTERRRFDQLILRDGG